MLFDFLSLLGALYVAATLGRYLCTTLPYSLPSTSFSPPTQLPPTRPPSPNALHPPSRLQRGMASCRSSARFRRKLSASFSPSATLVGECKGLVAEAVEVFAGQCGSDARWSWSRVTGGEWRRRRRTKRERRARATAAELQWQAAAIDPASDPPSGSSYATNAAAAATQLSSPSQLHKRSRELPPRLKCTGRFTRSRPPHCRRLTPPTSPAVSSLSHLSLAGLECRSGKDSSREGGKRGECC